MDVLERNSDENMQGWRGLKGKSIVFLNGKEIEMAGLCAARSAIAPYR
jgi:hypothetical protein